MINRGMSIEDVINRYPGTMSIFERHGLGCAGCRAALFKSIEQGAKVQGIDVDALITDLNVAISEG
jgi:hybrid cluster-associated redox disulfide protein